MRTLIDRLKIVDWFYWSLIISLFLALLLLDSKQTTVSFRIGPSGHFSVWQTPVTGYWSNIDDTCEPGPSISSEDCTDLHLIVSTVGSDPRPVSTVSENSQPVSTVEHSSIILNIPDSNQRAYVDRFYEVAKAEESRFGIPVSITLAQGLLESASGSSSLARESNNHFGIKYYGMQYIPEGVRPLVTGYSINHDDCRHEHYWSDVQIEGQEVVRHTARGYRMCPNPDRFVKYRSAWASYRHHSYVVTKQRYTRYNPNTYNEWAWAFKSDRGGYATNPNYHTLLINLIHRLGLNKLDQ